MRLVILPLIALAAAATPALANEARVEARGGVIWDGGVTEDVWGIAAGYDWDLGEKTFVGLEVSGDKIGVSGTKVAFGFTGRAGAKLSDATKLYADVGYTTAGCTGCEDAINLGAGVEHKLSGNVYGKLAYRHYFIGNSFSDSDAVVAGVGFKF